MESGKSTIQPLGQTSLPLMLLFGTAFLGAAELGHTFSFPGNMATFWPPAGVTLAVLLLSPLSRWPAFLLVALVGNLTSDILFHGKPPFVALGFCIANCCETLTAALLMRRFVGQVLAFQTLKEVIRLIIYGALLSSAIGATLGTLVVANSFVEADFASTWRTWWVADSLGVILLTPFVTTVIKLYNESSRPFSLPGEQSSPRRLQKRPVRVGSSLVRTFTSKNFLEVVLVFATLMFASQVVFGNAPNPLAFIVFPILIWIALRFEMSVISVGNLILAFIAIWNTRLGNGPFSAYHPVGDQVILLQSFLSIAAATSLILAAVVNEKRIALQIIQENESRYRDLLENVNDCVHSVGPDGRILYANKAWKEALGYDDEELKRLTVFQIVHPEELAACKALLSRILSGENFDHWERRFVTKSGATIIAEGSSNCRFIEGQAVATRAIFRDITKRRQHEQELESYRQRLEDANQRLHQLATTDGLTELQNRRAFQIRLQEEVDRAERYGTDLSLLILDIDHFKQFNDTFGHPAGDDVLKRVSRLLESAARTSDFVARFGGEEFAVILPNTNEHSALNLAERFRLSIQNESWRLRRITASIGVATLTAGCLPNGVGGSGSSLIQAADDALYTSKRLGRNQSKHADQLEPTPV